MSNLTGNSSVPLPEPPSGLDAFVYVYGLLFLIGVTGNLFVIFLILRCLKLKNISNVYIFNLALADILYLIWLPFVSVGLVKRDWPWGKVACKLHYFSTGVNRYGSSMFLTVLCVDRFLAVCFPICSRSYRTLRWSLATVAICWVCVGLLMMPVIFSAALNPLSNGKHECTMFRGHGNSTSSLSEIMDLESFTIYSVVVGLLFLFIMWGLYSLILHQLWCRRRLSNTSSRQKSTRKVTRTVFAILIFYTLCWGPLWIYNILFILDTLSHADPVSFMIASKTIYTLNYVNSALNPLLYTLMSDTYRTIINDTCCVKRPPAPAPHQRLRKGPPARDGLAPEEVPLERELNSVMSD